ncbi:MAG: hypothetical protein KF798_04920 [Candidatus Paracaedibacteraceae bacterium]|nr:hypothetical protein [Candidatus Paracaedibacteraceae bacterium]
MTKGITTTVKSIINTMMMHLQREESILPPPMPVDQVHADEKMRENMSEQQIDDMVKDSFPASDPPSTH